MPYYVGHNLIRRGYRCVVGGKVAIRSEAILHCVFISRTAAFIDAASEAKQMCLPDA